MKSQNTNTLVKNQVIYNLGKLLPQINRKKINQKTAWEDTAGFTLIEVLVVIIMIAVLSAIAAPSWLSFLNRQRLNKANDAIFAALQEAQREAKSKKLNYSVRFRTNQDTLQVAVYPSTSNPDNSWKDLVKDFEIKPGQLILGSNLADENEAGNTFSYLSNTKKETESIKFDHFGTLDLNIKTNDDSLTKKQDDALKGNKGLIITVAVPKAVTTNQPSDMKRCVAVKTIMGSMQFGADDECK